MADLALQADLMDSFKNLWMLNCAILVFFMQTGFAMLEAGTVEPKNIQNILLKITIDTCLGAIAYWLFGYGLAFGCKDGKCHPFAGNEHFALTDSKGDFFKWLFQFSFCAVSCTIVSGSVVGRITFEVYCLFAFLLTGFVQPVVAHWVWGGGFLDQHGVIDIAGGTAVHIVGGFSGLVATILIGPRHNRFEGKRFSVIVNESPAFSSTFGTLGVLILWFGWFGFNCGSVGLFRSVHSVELVAINTVLAPAGAVLTSLVVSSAPHFKTLDLALVLNSCLAGLVSITPGCAVLDPVLAFVSGCIGSVIYIYSSRLLIQLKIDDPLDAAPVHFFAGVWGLLLVGLFAKPDNVRAAYPNQPHFHNYGLFYGDNSGKLLLWEFISLLAASAWVGSVTFVFITVCRMLGILRVSKQQEDIGLDQVLHGQSAPKTIALRSATENVHIVGKPNSSLNRLVAL